MTRSQFIQLRPLLNDVIVITADTQESFSNFESSISKAFTDMSDELLNDITASLSDITDRLGTMEAAIDDRLSFIEKTAM